MTSLFRRRDGGRRRVSLRAGAGVLACAIVLAASVSAASAA